MGKEAQITTSVQRTVRMLRAGGVAAVPTDTLYGVLADALDDSAVGKVFDAKTRAVSTPLPIFISSIDDLFRYGSRVPEVAFRLANEFWPGKLTIVVPRSPLLSSLVSGGLDTIGMRIPDHPVPRAIVALLRSPVTATSANISGMPSLTSGADVARELGERLDIVFDGGELQPSMPSTVIDTSSQPPLILREGAVAVSDIEKVAGTVVAM